MVPVSTHSFGVWRGKGEGLRPLDPHPKASREGVLRTTAFGNHHLEFEEGPY